MSVPLFLFIPVPFFSLRIYTRPRPRPLFCSGLTPSSRSASPSSPGSTCPYLPRVFPVPFLLNSQYHLHTNLRSIPLNAFASLRDLFPAGDEGGSGCAAGRDARHVRGRAGGVLCGCGVRGGL